jgi:hypothetical protein
MKTTIKTKDDVTYKRGMTLYSIVPNVGGRFVSEHLKTYPHGDGRWQTDGSPGGAGVIAWCFSTERAAIEEIIEGLDAQIAELTTRRARMQAKLK